MDSVAIIMCTWKRPERFRKTLDQLIAQTNKNFVFYVWNNNVNICDEINLIYNMYKNKLSINIEHSNENVGGFGRFLLAKKIMNMHDKIIDRFERRLTYRTVHLLWALVRG